MTRKLLILVAATTCGSNAYAQTGAPVADAPSAADLLRDGTSAAEAGKLGEALELLRQAADGTANDAIRRRAMFNLGSVQLKRGEAALAEQDTERALAALRLAEKRYLGCVEMDRRDVEAARNVEHVRTLIRDIQVQQQQEGDAQQGEGEQGESQQGENGEQGEQDSQSQQGDAQQGQQGEGSNDAASDSPSPPSPMERLQDLARQQAQQTADTRERGSEGAEQSAADQSDLRDKTEQEAARADRQEIADSLRDAAKEQRAAEDALRQGDMSEANERQQAASRALEQAYAQAVQEMLEQMLATDPPQQADGAEGEPAPEQPPVDPIVQALIDREQDQRDARRRQGLMRSAPERVEKDW